MRFVSEVLFVCTALKRTQKSLKSISSLAEASGTLIQSDSLYSSKFLVSPSNPNLGTIGGFSSLFATPSQSIDLKNLQGLD